MLIVVFLVGLVTTGRLVMVGVQLMLMIFPASLQSFVVA